MMANMCRRTTLEPKKATWRPDSTCCACAALRLWKPQAAAAWLHFQRSAVFTSGIVCAPGASVSHVPSPMRAVHVEEIGEHREHRLGADLVLARGVVQVGLRKQRVPHGVAIEHMRPRPCRQRARERRLSHARQAGQQQDAGAPRGRRHGGTGRHSARLSAPNRRMRASTAASASARARASGARVSTAGSSTR